MNLIIVSISTCLVSLLIISILTYMKLVEIKNYLYMTKELKEIDTQEHQDTPDSIIGNEFNSPDKESVYENKTKQYEEELEELNNFKFLTRTPKIDIDSFSDEDKENREKELIETMMKGLNEQCQK